MRMFIQHKLVETDSGYDIILYIDPLLTEFASELGRSDNGKRSESLRESVVNYIRERVPDVKINGVKIMIGTMLLTTMFLAGPMAESAKAATSTGAQATQQVGQGIRVTINGQTQSFSVAPVARNGTTYVPVRDLAEALGGNVWWNGDSKTVGVNQGDNRIAFVVGATTARVNGKTVSMLPSYVTNGTTMVPVRFLAESLGMNVGWNDAANTVTITNKTSTYMVKSGDSLWKIANAHGVSVAQLQAANNLTGSVIYAGQRLVIPSGGSAVTPAPTTSAPTAGNRITYETYTVQSGDNVWSLSIKFGLPQSELLKVNNLTTSSRLSVGQKLTIPVHHIAVQPTVSAKHGEYLDWWTEAQYVLPINKVATITDFQTGRSFQVKRTIGANHSDTEPLTSRDAAIIKEVWGGAYSWKERAVIVSVDGRKIAASMASMPHDVDYVANNNFSGHFDLHFKNSTRHVDGAVSEAHQRQVAIAAGVSGA